MAEEEPTMVMTRSLVPGVRSFIVIWHKDWDLGGRRHGQK